MDFKTKANNVEVVVNEASWEDGMTLKCIMQNEFLKAGIKVDIGNLKIEDDIDFTKLMNAFMQIDGSMAVHYQIIKCLERSIYDKEKITKNTFDSSNARKDYYELVFACLKVNLGPFLEALLSAFSEHSGKIGSIIQGLK